MKKRQRKVRLIRAAIQLVFFIFYPALFSTAFAGVKSVFQAIAAHQQIAWNSFLDVTGLLLLVTMEAKGLTAVPGFVDMHVHSVHWEMPCMN